MKLLIFFFLIPFLTQSQTIPLAIRMDLVTRLELQPCQPGGKVATLSVKVKDYDVYQTAAGQFYINYTNSRLMLARKYLGYTHGFNYRYENNTVFFSADTTKAWIWTVDRYGQVYKMDMPDFFATDLKIIKPSSLKPNSQSNKK